MRIVRQSKVRHVYGESAKSQDQYTNLRLAPLTGDQQHIKANTKYFAVPVGRGTVTVLNLCETGRLPVEMHLLDGHRGRTTDFDFSHHDEDIVATGGEDCLLKVWKIPGDGLKASATKSSISLDGHQKKLTMVKFHKTVSSLIVTGSSDNTTKTWDLNEVKCRSSVAFQKAIQDISFNHTGALMAVSTKDKLTSICDPRTDKIVMSVEAHDGAKPCKSLFLGASGNLSTVGFSRNSTRAFKLWDLRNGFSQPFVTCKIDQASGSLMPFYDEGLNILYLAGKGESNVRYYELTESSPWQFKIDDFRSIAPCKGMCMMPKRTVDVQKHEINRFLRLSRDAVVPVSFFCPRKSEIFQADIYPDCFNGVPSATSQQFFSSSLSEEQMQPNVGSLNPDSSNWVGKVKKSSSNGHIAQTSASKDKIERPESKTELDLAKEYISTLQNSLKVAGCDVPDPPNGLSR